MSDLEARLMATGAVLSGHFRLSSGLHSPRYVQCARLLEDPGDADALGEQLAALLRRMGVQRIVAPALGGVIIGYTVARALGVPMVFTERKEGVMTLRRGFTIPKGDRVAIVEDVVTTGKSTREAAGVVVAEGGEVVAYGAILNRSGRNDLFDRPFVHLGELTLETYEGGNCPLCASGIAIDAPGSRFGASGS
ncbi:MAG TPA: orotate phosphoribosyltransferase [Thermoanaerobaculia bacterium]|nr:orotate phosphoribosyltransferase [Thermoanaerobaculia bacterium]